MAKTTSQVRTALETRRDAILDELAALSSSAAGGKPNSSGPGLHIDHQGYKKALYEELEQIRTALATYDGGFVTHRGA